MSLKDEGFRYLVRADKERAKWVHPAGLSEPQFTGWTDCTDMPDEEFDAFMRSKGD